MTVTLVAAVGRNGVIGRDGGLAWQQIPHRGMKHRADSKSCEAVAAIVR